MDARPVTPHQPSDVRVDLLLDPFGARWSELRDAASAAVESGFGGIWTYDHVDGHVYDATAVLECWTVLSALAAVVPQAVLGPLVVNVANQLPEERDRATIISSNLVKWALRADGAVLTKTGGGAPHVDMALVAERCEQLGVKTTMLAWDLTSPDDGLEGASLFNSPLLDAIVSVGSNNFDLPMAPVERVIAPSAELAERYQGQLSVHALRAVGAMDQLGGSRLTAALY